MAIKEVSRMAVSAFYKRHALEGERGYVKRHCKYYFITKNAVPRGYICISNSKLSGVSIASIFVRPEDRLQGYGSKLVGYATYNGLTISTAADDSCIGFFYKLGFSEDFLLPVKEGRIMMSKQ